MPTDPVNGYLEHLNALELDPTIVMRRFNAALHFYGTHNALTVNTAQLDRYITRRGRYRRELTEDLGPYFEWLVAVGYRRTNPFPPAAANLADRAADRKARAASAAARREARTAAAVANAEESKRGRRVESEDERQQRLEHQRATVVLNTFTAMHRDPDRYFPQGA